MISLRAVAVGSLGRPGPLGRPPAALAVAAAVVFVAQFTARRLSQDATQFVTDAMPRSSAR
jgi:hypothetical protein